MKSNRDKQAGYSEQWSEDIRNSGKGKDSVAPGKSEPQAIHQEGPCEERAGHNAQSCDRILRINRMAAQLPQHAADHCDGIEIRPEREPYCKEAEYEQPRNTGADGCDFCFACDEIHCREWARGDEGGKKQVGRPEIGPGKCF